MTAVAQTSATLPGGVTVEIRPGIFRPDWSTVTTPRAHEALAGRLAARAGLLDRWAVKLRPDADLVWRTILQLFAQWGRAPMRREIVAASGIAADDVETLLHALRSYDLVDLDPDTGEIELAYPLSRAATAHRVVLHGRVLHALCAIDALGVGAMYRADIAIASSCHHCGAPVQLETTSRGTALKNVAPTGAIVWYDFAYGRSAAASCCPAIAFFCSEEHRYRHLDSRSLPVSGVGLAMDEALEVGRAIFGPVLVTLPT